MQGKWIDDLKAAMPVADAARLALRVRLEVVHAYLEPVLKSSEKDPEMVHDLRVGTRRATAALDVFAYLLPNKACKKARKRLKKLRRAAGMARDWDVFFTTLDEQTPLRAGGDALRGYVIGRRLATQAELRQEGQAFADNFEAFSSGIITEVASEPGKHEPQVLRGLAGPLLSDLLEELRQAAGRDLTDFAHLHRVRIIGKRLRYAMELFVDCFEAPFRDQLYPLVEEMQDILGRANDSHVAHSHLGELRRFMRAAHPKLWKRYKADVDALQRFHQRRLTLERRAFVKWWRAWEQTHHAVFAALLS